MTTSSLAFSFKKKIRPEFLEYANVISFLLAVVYRYGQGDTIAGAQLNAMPIKQQMTLINILNKLGITLQDVGLFPFSSVIFSAYDDMRKVFLNELEIGDPTLVLGHQYENSSQNGSKEKENRNCAS